MPSSVSPLALPLLEDGSGDAVCVELGGADLASSVVAFDFRHHTIQYAPANAAHAKSKSSPVR